ncbi:serine hydrolase domain-containing protein [Kribbella sp. NPDC002412]
MGSSGERMVGFPPTAETLVDLAGWRDAANVRWAFRHMRELMPTHVIPADPDHTRPLTTALDPAVGATPVTRLDGAVTRADGVFADTWTDALIVLHDGVVAEERYFAGMTANTPHLLLSVSQSIVGCVAGILAGRGSLDPEAPVTTYVPEVAGTGYGHATVRHLLDMRTGVAFHETSQAIDSEVRVMERSMGWRPRRDGDPAGLYEYLTTLGTATPHGGPFAYRSADTDMLGWVCERAAGTRMADLVSRLLWAPMGTEQDADITCDPVGSAVHADGISATARDLARFGQLLLENDDRIVPKRWLAESWHPGADVRTAFSGTDNEAVLAGGWYRNQFWFVPDARGTALACLGFHGQMLYVNPATKLVGVKLSSWPDPRRPAYLVDTLRAFGAIGAQLSG